MVHPATKIASFGKRLPVFQHPVKYRLHHIFAGLAPLRKVKQKPKQSLMVPLKEQTHSFQVTGFHL
jgi:hypothetical protein